jgi:hypothetical protein
MMHLAAALALLLLPSGQNGSDKAPVVVEAGRENWEKPWVPDFAKPDGRIEIPAEKRVDVAILGDGYTADEREAFEKDVKAWYERFQKYIPWQPLRGAFRVRGVFTPGEGRATPEKKSHFRIPAEGDLARVPVSDETRDAMFAALDALGVNKAQDARGRMTHCVVVMLVKNAQGRNPSGVTRPVAKDKVSVSVAFAAYTHHEFGHAFGGLRDEYIRGEGSRTEQKPPEKISMFTVSNLAYTNERKLLPWAHLAPGSSLNPDAASVVGACWLGGIAETGVWHSEAKCLMNGTHENWSLDKTKRGVTLRDMNRFCFWCEEICVAKTMWKTGRLGDSTEGEALWKKWEEMRPLYHKALDVAGRIKAQNEANAKAKLPEAKIYVMPK